MYLSISVMPLFARCENLHAVSVGMMLLSCIRVFICTMHLQEDPTLVHEHLQQKQSKAKKRGNLDKTWSMPNVLVDFMSHLPKTAMALPIKPLRWIIRQAKPCRQRHPDPETNSPHLSFSLVHGLILMFTPGFHSLSSQLLQYFVECLHRKENVSTFYITPPILHFFLPSDAP